MVLVFIFNECSSKNGMVSNIVKKSPKWWIKYLQEIPKKRELITNLMKNDHQKKNEKISEIITIDNQNKLNMSPEKCIWSPNNLKNHGKKG